MYISWLGRQKDRPRATPRQAIGTVYVCLSSASGVCVVVEEGVGRAILAHVRRVAVTKVALLLPHSHERHFIKKGYLAGSIPVRMIRFLDNDVPSLTPILLAYTIFSWGEIR